MFDAAGHTQEYSMEHQTWGSWMLVLIAINYFTFDSINLNDQLQESLQCPSHAEICLAPPGVVLHPRTQPSQAPRGSEVGGVVNNLRQLRILAQGHSR